MVRASPMMTNFTSGEWSPLMDGYINLERYPSSSKLIENLICLKQGPMVRRGGTRYVKEVKDSSANTVLIDFEFNAEQTYHIEAGDEYFRFFTNNASITETAQNITAITQADPAVLTYTGTDPSNGDEVYISGVAGMTEVNGKYFLVSNVNGGANTFELQDIDGNDIDSTGYTAYTSGGTIAVTYEITSPYAASDLLDSDYKNKFQYAQSADVLYISHGDFNTRAVVRASNASWSVNDLEFVDGPYLDTNLTDTTITLSGTTGSVTVTASAVTGINNDTGFQTTDVGRLIRFKDPAGDWTWLEITAHTSTTVVTATIKGEDASAGTATKDWRLGVYSDTTGYPKVITFFQDRVCLANCDSYPDRWDLSRTGGYSDTQLLFAPTDADGTVTDDASIYGTLQSGKVNAIQWAGTDDRGLIMGTSGREWIIRPSTSNEVLTPSNAKADAFSSVGSIYVQPVQAETGTVFVQRARRKLLDIVYSFERDQLNPRDLTIPWEHLTRTGVAEIQLQQEPINCIWVRLTDGSLRGFTYYPQENVFAAHRHPIGGSGVVRSISIAPAADGTRDEVWLIVSRTINGTTRQYIEYMTRYYEDDIDKEDAFHVDSGLTYDSTATSTVSGLDHLEGEIVKVLIDGNSHPDLTVTNGSVTLENDRTASVIQVGLGAPWAWKSQRIEAGATDGVAQGKVKRVVSFVVRLLNTLGLDYGASSTVQDEYDFNQGAEYDEDLALFSGDTGDLSMPNGADQEGFIYLSHDGAFPACIQAVMPQVTTYGKI